MGTDPEAKLFYGYIQPLPDEDDWENDSSEEEEDEEETPWENTHCVTKHGCIGGISGYDENLRHFLAVEKSLSEAQWSNVVALSQDDFEIRPEWKDQLQQAVEAFGLDVSGMQPGWYLVCLYF